MARALNLVRGYEPWQRDVVVFYHTFFNHRVKGGNTEFRRVNIILQLIH